MPNQKSKADFSTTLLVDCAAEASLDFDLTSSHAEWPSFLSKTEPPSRR